MLAVTGATGFVGQALLDRAVEEGAEVRALARRTQEPRDGLEWIAGDLENKAALHELMRGAEAVIHVAGVVNDAAQFESGNVTGTLNVIEAAKADAVLRQIPVLAVTAYAGKGDEERIRDAGAEGYLAKPVSIRPFMDAVKGLVERATA